MQACIRQNKNILFTTLNNFYVDLDYQNSEIMIPSCRMAGPRKLGHDFFFSINVNKHSSQIREIKLRLKIIFS